MIRVASKIAIFLAFHCFQQSQATRPVEFHLVEALSYLMIRKGDMLKLQKVVEEGSDKETVPGKAFWIEAVDLADSAIEQLKLALEIVTNGRRDASPTRFLPAPKNHREKRDAANKDRWGDPKLLLEEEFHNTEISAAIRIVVAIMQRLPEDIYNKPKGKLADEFRKLTEQTIRCVDEFLSLETSFDKPSCRKLDCRELQSLFEFKHPVAAAESVLIKLFPEDFQAFNPKLDPYFDQDTKHILVVRHQVPRIPEKELTVDNRLYTLIGYPAREVPRFDGVVTPGAPYVAVFPFFSGLGQGYGKVCEARKCFTLNRSVEMKYDGFYEENFFISGGDRTEFTITRPETSFYMLLVDRGNNKQNRVLQM